MTFKEKVLKIVLKIPEGKFLTYKDVAQKIGKPKAYRAVANILAKNRDPKIPCHRIIRNDYLVGGYYGKENLSWMKAGLLLKEGAIGVIPTDTIYGICTSAFKKESVEKVYKLRKRNPEKPCIILITNLDDLRKFKIRLTKRQKEIIEKIKGLKVSFVLSCPYKEFSYLHRGTKTLSFRILTSRLTQIFSPINADTPRIRADSIIRDYPFKIRENQWNKIRDYPWLILKVSGPIIAPSANWEDYEPAKNIKEAKKYFFNKVFYLNAGNLISKPSTLIDLTQKEIKILREGADVEKLLKILF